MLPESKMARLNALARKSKTLGLSSEEQDEQQKLRQEYLANFRREFRSQLDRIEIVEDGDETDRQTH